MEWAVRLFEGTNFMIRMNPSELAQTLFNYVRKAKLYRSSIYDTRFRLPEVAEAKQE